MSPPARSAVSVPPPLLLLHGFLGRGADWDPFRQALTHTASQRGAASDDAVDAVGEVQAPDLPGHGGAIGLPPEAYTMDGAADALAARLGRPADLVGYSMGGRLALALALRHPERVRRLVLISASPGLETADARAARRRLDVERAAEIERDLPGFVARWADLPLFASMPSALRADRAAQQRANVPDELARSLAGMGTGAQASYWERLVQLPASTMSLAGARDTKFVGIAREMAARSSGQVRAAVIGGVGHAPHLEAPDETARLVLNALRGDAERHADGDAGPGASPGAPR